MLSKTQLDLRCYSGEQLIQAFTTDIDAWIFEAPSIGIQPPLFDKSGLLTGNNKKPDSHQQICAFLFERG